MKSLSQNIASLTMSFPVKYVLSILIRALRIQHPTKARSQSSQVRNSVRPMHLFGHTVDHDIRAVPRARGALL
jgi:hypothetical protein